MGAVSELARLIRLGFPEEVAKRIASGELDMSAEARMARAREQGYDVDNIQYHGSRADINEFKPSRIGEFGGGVYTTDAPKEASSYANINRSDGGGSALYPVLTKGELFDATGSDFWSRFMREGDTDEDVVRKAMEAGYDGVLKNRPFSWYDEGTKTFKTDGTEIQHRNIFDPSNIRSVNAAFDPQYKGPNILGQYALPATGAAALAAGSDDADAGFVTQITKSVKRQADENLPWANEIVYTHEPSGGIMKLAEYPDGRVSTLELEVPEEHRRQGIGASLQEAAITEYPEMMGQVSSQSALKSAYRLGRRPVGNPEASLEDALRLQAEATSVNMQRPVNANTTSMGAKRFGGDPAFADAVAAKRADYAEMPEMSMMDAEHLASRLESTRDPLKLPGFARDVLIAAEAGAEFDPSVLAKATDAAKVEEIILQNKPGQSLEDGFNAMEAGYQEQQALLDNIKRQEQKSKLSVIDGAKRGNATPEMMMALALGSGGATAAASEGLGTRLMNHIGENVTEVLDLLEVPQRGLQGLIRAGYGLTQGERLEASLMAGADVVENGVEAAAKAAGDKVLEETGSPELAAMAYTATILGSPI